jgi:ubiquinone/menaquinone biosynthesis C-methylase UbiE
MIRRSVLLAKKYLSLAPAKAPKYWTEPQALERASVEYQDEVAGGFLKWFPELVLEGKDVFDIGCGYGGRPVRYCELGAASVAGIEISTQAVREAGEFAESKGIRNATFVVAEGENLPFPARSFDAITSYDVFEHVNDLERTLHECMRVLRPQGRLYAVFPPFYHPTGAHLDAWLSKMPWANVFFRCETLIEAAYQLLEERGDSYRPHPLRSTDKLWALNGATVASVRGILSQDEFLQHDLRLAPLFSPLNATKWESWKMKYYAFAFKPLRRLPGLREAFVHRIALTVTKPSSPSAPDTFSASRAHHASQGGDVISGAERPSAGELAAMVRRR